MLSAYRWPGNVRELKNVVERIAVRQQGGRIEAADLPSDLTGQALSARPENLDRQRSVADVLYDKIIAGESFWSAVYNVMARDPRERTSAESCSRAAPP